MFRVSKLRNFALLLATAATAFAAGDGAGVSPRAEPLFFNGTFTNAIITAWAFTGVIILLLMWMVGKPSIRPSKGQAVMEALITGLRDLFEPIVGKKAFPAAFPLLATLFIFILVNNWMGLIPGVGTIGWHGHDAAGHEHFTPLIRPFTSDFNGTIALALLSFGAWAIIVFKYAGPKVLFIDLFGNKADKAETPGWLYPILTLVFLIVGCIEVFSIFIRPFTLSVRLFGNIFGGENLLHGTGFFFVFYFMEMLVGLIQATVFTLLSAVYIGLICNHGDDHDHEEGHAEAH
ncbi:F0F1 ATP synthase subunit A [Actomonas aquatica]|uniref:ATP synthase subunit a n=1 Tax=Actomonas aquatica TaxID=2866162 RepID=A0ABZ1C490_9BACT|nr:F0F1 ATP synthase subunit A [Opitutus sp. WL0086]WRQ86118.1 F0F1 ATP synthase subunit A [Opitutus sp. WL0086]